MPTFKFNVNPSELTSTTDVLDHSKPQVYCWKCKAKTHATKDCTVEHYCYVCDNAKHPTSKCPTLKLPKSTTFVAGFGDEDLMFTQFPDSVYKAQIAANSDPTACVVVQGRLFQRRRWRDR